MSKKQNFYIPEDEKNLADLMSGKKVSKHIAELPEDLAKSLLKNQNPEAFGIIRKGNVPERYFTHKKYRDAVDPLTMDYDTMEKRSQELQSGWEVANNMFGQFAGGLISGFIEGFTPLDIITVSEVYDKDNTSTNFGNSINYAMNQLREWNEKQYPIFNSNPDDIFSGRYLAKQFGGQGYTFGIMGSTVVQAALIEALTSGAGSQLAAARAGTNMLKLGKFLSSASKGAKGALKLQKGIAKSAALGAMNGLQETYLNTLETGRQEFEKYKDAYGEELAVKKARETMQEHLWREAGPAVALNMLSWGVTARFAKAKNSGFGAKGGTEVATGYSDVFATGVDKIIGKVVKNKTAQKAIGFTTATLSEGIEESIQKMAGSAASYSTDKKYSNNKDFLTKEGLAKDLTEGKSLSSYLFDNELRDSFIGGLMGGLMFSGARTIGESTREKKIKQQIEKDLELTTKRQQELSKKLAKLVENKAEAINLKNSSTEVGEQNLYAEMEKTFDLEIKNIQDALSLSTIQSALSIDYVRGDGNFTTFNSVVANMESTLEAVKNGDIKKLKEIGFDSKAAQDFISENFQEMIDAAYSVKNSIVSTLEKQQRRTGKENFYAAEKTALHEYVNERNAKVSEKIRQNINEIFEEVGSTNSEEALYLKMISELDAYKRRDLVSDLSKEEKKAMKELEKEVSEFEKREDFEDRFKPISANEQASKEFEKLHRVESSIADSKKEIHNLMDEKYATERLRKDRVAAAKRKVENARTKEEIEVIKQGFEETKGRSIFTEEEAKDLEEAIEKKSKAIQVHDSEKERLAKERVDKAAERLEEKKNAENQQGSNENPVEPITTQPKESNERDFKEEVSTEELAKTLRKLFNEESARESGKDFIVIASDEDDLFLEEVPSAEESSQDTTVAKRAGEDRFLSSPVKGGKSQFEEALLQIAKKYLENIPTATLEDYVSEMLRHKGIIDPAYVKKYFNAVADTFYEASDKPINAKEKQDVFNKLFVPLDVEALKSAFELVESSSQPTTTVVETASNEATTDSVETTKTNEPADDPVINTPEEVVIEELPDGKISISLPTGVGEERKPIVYAGRRTAAPYLKIPFSGRAYETSAEIDENGTIVIHKTDDFEAQFDRELSIESGENREYAEKLAFVLNPDLAAQGAEVRVYIPTGEKLNSSKVVVWDWSTIPANKTVMSFGEWLAINKDVKEGDEKWLSKVPVLMEVKIGDSWVPVDTAFHEVDWWNEQNVVDLPKDRKLQEEFSEVDLGVARESIIESGKRLTLEARKRVWEEGGRTDGKYVYMEVSKVTPGISLTIPKNQMARPISEVNNALEIVPFIQVLDNGEGFPKEYDPDGKVTSWYSAEEIYNFDSIQGGHEGNSNVGKAFSLIPYHREKKDGPVTYLAQFIITNSPSSQKAFKQIAEAKWEIWNLIKTLSNTTDTKKKEDAVKKLTEIFELAGVPKNKIEKFSKDQTTSFAQSLFEEYLEPMYPVKIGNSGVFRANVAKQFLKNGIKGSGKLVVLSQDGKFELYESQNPFPGDSPYVQMLKDTITTNHDYAEIPVLGTDKKKKVADIQPRIELSFTKKEPKIDPENISGIDKETDKVTNEVAATETVSQVASNDSSKTTEETDTEVVTEEKSDGSNVNQDSVIDDNGEIIDISEGQRELIVRNLFHNIVKYLTTLDTITKKDIKDVLDVSIEKFLSEMEQDYPNEYKYLLDHKEEILGLGSHKNDIGTVKDILSERFGFDDDTFEEVDETTEMEKDYTKSNLEYSAKTSLSERAKMTFSAIKVTDERRTLPRFGNLSEYMEPDDVFSALQEILSDTDNTDKNFQQRIKEKIDKNPIEFGFLNEVRDTFNSLHTEQKTELLFRLNQTKVSMEFVYAQDRNGSFTLQVLDANSRNPLIGTKIAYGENLKTSPLIMSIDKNTYKINKSIAEELLGKIDKILKKGNDPSSQSIAEALSYFGVDVYPDVLQSISNEELGDSSVAKTLLKALSDNLKNFLNQQEKKGKTFDITNKEENVLYRQTNNYLKSFIEKVVEHTLNESPSMYIDGKTINSFSQPNLGTEQMRKLKETTFESVKNPSSLVSRLANTGYAKNSLLLKLMLELNNPDKEKATNLSESARKIIREMGVSYVSINALKKRFGMTPDRNGITDLSPIDYDVLQLGAFQHMGAIVKNSRLGDLGISLRMARMFFPALSDSSQMLFLNMPVLDLKHSNFNFNSDTAVIEGVDEGVGEILYEQLVLPELTRMVEHKLSKSNKIFGVGGDVFLSTPSLNMVKNDAGITILEYLKASNLETTEALLAQITDEFKKNFTAQIVEVAKANARKFLEIKEDGNLEGSWVKDGILSNEDVSSKIQILDSKYLSERGVDSNDKDKTLKQAQIAAYDLAINNLIAQAQVQMLFAGDIANYASFRLDGFHKGDISKPIGTTEEEKAMRYLEISERTGSNLSKRLKAIISPGNRIANSKGKKYYQLMIEDVEETSFNFEQYVELWYGKEVLGEEVKEKIQTLYNKTRKLQAIIAEDLNVHNIGAEEKEKESLQEEIKALKKELGNKFPAVASYLENAATDAQEYVTWREHLEILRNTGKISDEQYEEIKKKLIDQDTNGVNDSNRLSADQKIAFQPMKPLHSGMYFDRDDNGNLYQKLVYVKSSAFPLLPELTVGLPLDNLRKNMQRLEEFDSNGNILVPVRASFQTANKVGAVKNPANFHLLTSNGEISKTGLSGSYMLLDRENFSIQQEKPDKTAKHLASGKRDEINIGTQIEKILLGSNINKREEKIFPNKFSKKLLDELGIVPVQNEDGSSMVSGKDLDKIYTYLYTALERDKRDILLESLNIDKDSFELGSIESMERFQDALSQRLSNKQDKEILELKYIVENADGTISSYTKDEIEANPELVPIKAEFTFPIWLSPNARKFESVLNAIVTNELVKLKLPGNSFVVGSSQGVTRSVALSETDSATRQGIVWISKEVSEQDELKAERVEDGVVKPAQVVIASKFRKRVQQQDGSYKEELIDFRKEGLIDENGFLDTSKIDPSVLELMSFRIPTSAHMSGSLLQVVGFLPPESTDLMLVPKEHTTKIGEDYDIDARYTYSGNFSVKQDKATGEVEKISFLKEDYVDAPLRREQAENYQQYRREIAEYIDSLNLSENFKKTVTEKFLSHKDKEILSQYLQYKTELEGIEKELGEINAEDSTEEDIETALLKTRRETLLQDIKELEVEASKSFLRSTINFSDEKESLESIYNNFQSKNKEAALQHLSSIRRKARNIRLIENEIINAYKSVYSSSDTEVRKLINSTINTDLSDVTVKDMEKVVSTADPNTFSLFSTQHQKAVLSLGAVGKMGIGVHSNWVVFNSLLQQLDEPLVLINQRVVDSHVITVPVSIRIGNFQSDGSLGRVKALSPISDTAKYKDVEVRTIADINMENQNCSTDNQKKGVMGRRNENKYTINVFAILCNLGFDKDIVNGKEMHLPSLFLNQPILRRYVELMEDNSSHFTEYSSNVEERIMAQLREEFGVEESFTEGGYLKNDVLENYEELMTGQALFDSLGVPKEKQDADWKNMQCAVLSKFMLLRVFSEDISLIQKTSNVRSLGKSYFDILGTKNTIFEKMVSIEDNPKGLKIRGVEQLFGESYEGDLYDNPEDMQKVRKLEAEGYIVFGLDSKTGKILLRKPNSANSSKLLYSISTGYRLWSNVFPYENKYFSEQLDDVLESSGKTDMYTASAMDVRFDVKNSMQEFIYSIRSLRIFEGVENINEERRRLFMDEYDDKDNRTKDSLATYLNSLKMMKNKDLSSLSEEERKVYTTAIELFNKTFFKNLVFEISRNSPSIIKYNISNTSSFNKNRSHSDITSIMDSKQKLPPFNGNENYTLEDLVKDLTKYALLSNPENGAIGFRNQLPMAVFKKYEIDKDLLIIGDIQQNGGRVFNSFFNGQAKALASLTNGRLKTDFENRVVEVLIPEDRNFNLQELKDLIARYNAKIGIPNFYKLETSATGSLRITIQDPQKYNLSKGRFLRQYYQHNPQNAYKLSSTVSGIKKGKVALTGSFVLSADAMPQIPDFVSMVGENGKRHLFELKAITSEAGEMYCEYVQIATLGGSGVNEYNPDKDVNVSMFPENNLPDNLRDAPTSPKNKNAVEKALPKIVEEVISDIVNNPVEGTQNTEDAKSVERAVKIVEFFHSMGLIDQDLKVVLEDLGEGTLYGKYAPGSKTITMNEFYYHNNRNEYIIAFAEELTHSVLTRFTDQYLRNDVAPLIFDGNTITINSEVYRDSDNIPASVQTFMMVYGKASEELLKKVARLESAASGKNTTVADIFNKALEYRKWLLDKKGPEPTLSNKEVDDLFKAVAYRVTNIDEFIAGTLDDADFKKALSESEYLQSGKTFLEKLAEIFTRFIDSLSFMTTGKNLDTSAVEAVLGLVEDLHVKEMKQSTEKKTKPLTELRSTDKMVEEILEDGRNEVQTSTTSGIKPGVSELFESNPRLADEVYEALGFGQESNLPTGEETINIYAGTGENAEAQSVVASEVSTILSRITNEAKTYKLEVRNGQSVYTNGEEVLERQSSAVQRLIGREREESNDNMKMGASVGNLVDIIGRDIFSEKGAARTVEEYREELSEMNSVNGFEVVVDQETIDSIITVMSTVKESLRGWRFLSNDMFLRASYNQEQKALTGLDGIGGTLDLLGIDPEGNLHIIDFKNKKLLDGENQKRNFVKYMLEDSTYESNLTSWSRQQTAYKVLAESLGLEISSINILPVATTYSQKGNVLSVTNVQLGTDVVREVGEDIYAENISRRSGYLLELRNDDRIEKLVTEAITEKPSETIVGNSENSIEETRDVEGGEVLSFSPVKKKSSTFLPQDPVERCLKESLDTLKDKLGIHKHRIIKDGKEASYFYYKEYENVARKSIERASKEVRERFELDDSVTIFEGKAGKYDLSKVDEKLLRIRSLTQNYVDIVLTEEAKRLITEIIEKEQEMFEALEHFAKLDELFKNGPVQKNGYTITEEEAWAMSWEEQESLLECK